MATFARQTTRKNQAQAPEYGVYARNMIQMKVHLKMSEIGNATKQNLEKKVLQKTEGKCIPEGYVRPDSIKLINYSSGVVRMNLIEFQVVFECLICNPVEGMIVECTTKSITKAGIHAEVITDKGPDAMGYMPMKIFVARDHNYANRLFGEIKENAKIKVSIIGKRFELNDPYIVAIASLVDKDRAKAKIRVLDDKPVGPLVPPEPEEDEPEEPEEEEPEEEEAAAPISIPTALPKKTEQEEGELEEGEERE